MKLLVLFLTGIRLESVVKSLSTSPSSRAVQPRRRALLSGVKWNELCRDLKSLQAGIKISDGIAATAIFQGKNGPKMWVDVGAYNDVQLNNGTVIRRRILGLLKLPKNVESSQDPRWAKVLDMLSEAETDPGNERIRCYVEAGRPESSRLVLRAAPLPKKRRKSSILSSIIPLEKCISFDELVIGTELQGAVVSSVGQTLCRLNVAVRCDKRRVGAFLRAKDLPNGIILSTAPIKNVDARILRQGDRLDSVFIKRLHPQSLGIDVALEPVNPIAVQNEERKQKIERRKRRARTANLKPGDIIQGKVTRIRNYGATVDFGASATGLILRKAIPLVEMKKWLDSTIQCIVVDVERDGRPDTAPRVTLERLASDEDPSQAEIRPDGIALQVSGISNTNLVVDEKVDVVDYDDEQDDLGLDGLDDIDDIESSLGLDVY